MKQKEPQHVTDKFITSACNIFKLAEPRRCFWKHPSLSGHNVKHQNQSKPAIDAAPVWQISEQAFEMVSLQWRWLKITGRQSAELNCWQPESKYISRSSNWLLFLLDIPGVRSWIVNTHCMILSQLGFFPLSFLSYTFLPAEKEWPLEVRGTGELLRLSRSFACL